MKEAVYRRNPEAEFYIDEGCYITELSNTQDAGSGYIEVGESLQEHVGEGDVVLIPAMSKQRITNTGIDDLVFLAICTPRFEHSDYEDCEE